ncbi:hypothetical protein CDO52_03655 [Nocardiopsis gilva YIM 90087]|uniref:Uncharacterized protein n=1 Tax=Nocardiopsis gilva YIM 90087 TaxID=1235441 RepID=A0A223S1M3_9ACTN|nr:hypothetical protein [Nocardiopsis gilva]ASU81997.1 hypothetical protein CDO52_03655 [Nocardiopsis gilva YIM 90087]
MRRARALVGVAAAVALLLTSACSGTAGTTGGGGGNGSAKETKLTGLALVFRGYEGGDPEESQALVFVDPDGGKEKAAVTLPERALDPMVSGIPAYSMFSDDWQYFVYSAPDAKDVQLARLNADQTAYEPVTAISPQASEEWGEPRIQGDRIWFSARTPGNPQSARVMSVPLDDPTASPKQAGQLPLGEGGKPASWELTPDGAVHIREQVPISQMTGQDGSSLTVRKNGAHLMNATLAAGGQQWQSLDSAPVWGEGNIVVGPADQGSGVPDGEGGARLVTLDDTGQGYTTTQLLDASDGVVVQYAPAPKRDGVLLQTDSTWYRVDLKGGKPSRAANFPAPRDASMDGYPLVAGWAT